ncbi:13283_t:CDS:1, partial [Acaulospora morrowiae]
MSTEKAPETSSTSKSDGEVFQLEALSLNYLRSQNILAIPDDNQLPRLHPCKLCNKAILNFRFEAFTVLCCGHLLHRICLETHIIRGGVREPSCPTCNWGIEINREELSLALGVYRIESKDNDKGQASQQSNVTITDEDDDGGLEIMRSMGLIEEDSATAEKTKPVNTEDRGTSPIASEVQVNSTDQDNANEIAGSSSPSLKRPYQLPSGNSQSTKKVKKSNEKKDGSKNRNEVSSNVAKKLIEELSTETSQISEVVEESTGNFHDLYVAINKAEEQSG